MKNKVLSPNPQIPNSKGTATLGYYLGLETWNLRLKTFTLLCIIVFSNSISAQNTVAAQIQRMQQDTDMSHSSWSVCVLDVKKDSILAEYNSHVGLIPASVQKIVTTSSALAMLKWDFKYETRLEYDGTLDTATGILKGNLYIKGSGDPTLSSKVFKKTSDTITLTDQWAKIISKKGIKKIEGSVIGDATAFEDEMVPYSWIWGDMGNYYGAGSCGLNFMDNKFALHFRTGSTGTSSHIDEIEPAIPGMRVINQTYVKGYSDNSYIYGSPYSLVRYIKGSLPVNRKDYEVEGSMPDPPLFCAQTLDSSLRKLGMHISGKARTLRSFMPPADEISTTTSDSMEFKPDTAAFRQKTKEFRTTLHIQTSHTLDKIVTETNIQSNNLYAETLLKTIAWQKTKFGDDMTGIDIVTNFWKSKGIDLKGWYMADGCGLSRFNSINTHQLSEMLRVITKDTLLFRKFYESLPVAGKSGSLGKLCKGSCAENNLHAKSGYMTRVRSYAGYVTSRKGNLLSFAIIVNNYDCTPGQMKDKLEKLMIAIAEIE